MEEKMTIIIHPFSQGDCICCKKYTLLDHNGCCENEKCWNMSLDIDEENENSL
jgi:hypothetical protein